MATVEVVIVTWNGREDTLRALESVLAQARPSRVSSVTVTVVDNGSSDGTRGAILARFPSVRVLQLAENTGFTGGVRLGVETSAADFAILLNNDAVAQPGWLIALADSMLEAPPDVIAVAGKIVDPSGTRADFVEGAMTFDGHAFQLGFRQPLAAVDERPAGSELLFACGGNMIVRREPFLQLGGFDDDYFAYLEDVDFGWRSWIAGWRVLWNPDAVVRHRSSATSERLGSFERGVLFERNALQTVVKNYEDVRFREIAGPIFLTALHRLHRYVVDRNRGTDGLRRPPLDGAPVEPRSPGHGLARRVARRLGLPLPNRSAVLEDELTEMQFRAIEWFFAHGEILMRKRHAVQSLRKRPDEEIFGRFPPLVVPTYPGDLELMSSSLFGLLLGDLPRREMSLEQILQRD